VRTVTVGRVGPTTSPMMASRMTLNRGSAGMGIQRGSVNNLGHLNHQVAKTGSAQVRPAPQFSATSPNRPSSPVSSYPGGSSSPGYAPARSNSMPSSMGRSAPAGHSAGGGVPHK
jgi:hypothetical protein